MNQIQTTFGGALSKALEQVANSGSINISVADAYTRESFIDSWSRTLSEHAKRLRQMGAALQAPVFIVHVGSTGEFAKLHSAWKRRQTLGASHIDNFTGLLAVGTASIGGYTHPNMLPDMNTFEAELHANDLQESPTIALVSETKLMIWPKGISAQENIFEKTLSDTKTAVNVAAIDNALAQFDELVARQNSTWWKNRTLRITVELPENTVQDDLWLYLTGTFSEVALIRKEEASGNGRRDLTVYPRMKNPQDQRAVLELKTLRDVRTPVGEVTAPPTKISLQENIDWACSGVQQTAAYRDSEKLDAAFLCLYDFCAGNTTKVEEAAAPHALQYNVILRRYWITASHKEYREHFYPLTPPAHNGSN
jgi:hypothetical protein